MTAETDHLGPDQRGGRSAESGTERSRLASARRNSCVVRNSLSNAAVQSCWRLLRSRATNEGPETGWSQSDRNMRTKRSGTSAAPLGYPSDHLGGVHRGCRTAKKSCSLVPK